MAIIFKQTKGIVIFVLATTLTLNAFSNTALGAGPGPGVNNSPAIVSENTGGPAVISPCGSQDEGVGFALSQFALGRCTFFNVKMAFPNLDIKRTVADMFVTGLTEITSLVLWGADQNQQQACMLYGINSVGGNVDIPDEIEDLATPARCGHMSYCPQSGEATNLPSRAYRGSSLAGLAVTTIAIADQGPMPSVNLANYGRYVASNTLLVKDTALAQGFPIPVIDNVVNAITKIWELMRNISYGLLAIFMIYVGAMIMMRKQISSQVVVTAQYAIPRIVISIVLITFSMAIGLLGIGLIKPLQLALIEPIRNMYVGRECLGPILTTSILAGSVFQQGVGITFIVLSVLIGAINIILWIMIMAKYIFTFLKLFASTIIAPLTFAWGAIPGNEDTIYDWFKYFLANMMALPAMAVTMEIGNYVVSELILNNILQSFSNTSSGSGYDHALLLFADGAGSTIFGLLISMFIFFQALKMPNKIEEAVMGPKKKK